MQHKPERAASSGHLRRRNVLIGIGLLFGCGLLAQLAPDRTVQPAALAPRVVPTFTNTPLAAEAQPPTETPPTARLLVATDTPVAAAATETPLPTLPPPLPTDTATAMPAPTEAPPATATSAPVEVIAAPIQVAPVLASGSSCDCSGDIYNCKDFASHADAQACFDYCTDQGFGDIHKLDGTDLDGLACENLP